MRLAASAITFWASVAASDTSSVVSWPALAGIVSSPEKLPQGKRSPNGGHHRSFQSAPQKRDGRRVENAPSEVACGRCITYVAPMTRELPLNSDRSRLELALQAA